MAIRLSGIASGLDTESMVKELMSAQNTKKTKIVNKQTKLTWTQEKWKDLNTKIYALYTGELSKMKLQSSYGTKRVTSSNESKVTATAGSSAPIGTQTITVDKLASSQYVTGAKVENVTNQSKLTELNGAATGTTFEPGMKITLTFPNKSEENTVSFTVEADSTVKDLTDFLKENGVNANFDEEQGRMFISSKNSGIENKFELTVGYPSTETIVTEYESVMDKLVGDKMTEESMNHIKSLIFSETQDVVTAKEYMTTLITGAEKNGIAASVYEEKARAVVNAKIKKDLLEENSTLTDEQIEEKLSTEFAKEEYQKLYNELMDSDKAGITTDKLKEMFTTKEIREAGLGEFSYESIEKDLISKATVAVENYANAYNNAGTSTPDAFAQLGLGEITSDTTASNAANGMAFVAASDAEVIINGAKMKENTNSFTVNGVTFNLKAVTEGETITLSVTNNTDAVYDMVKGFVSSYNTLLKEMNGSYYADSSRGYDPLTDEEKEAMSDDAIEKWETKIKDSLLRRDNTLGSLLSSMKTAMNTSVVVDGKSYSLSSFGICTSSDYSEKGLLHIYGDTTDSVYSSEEDKLKKAIEEDPELVTKVLTEISKNLYNTMSDKMKSTTLSSALTVYNDKQMTKLQTQYKEELANMEKKLQNMEEKYYSQFAAMETAMSKLNSQSTYISNLFGTN